jgi:predicted transcriptional regulator
LEEVSGESRFSSIEWIVPGIIPVRSVVILASAPKVGKTSFASCLVRALVRGEPFLGQPTHPLGVLWCAHEEYPLARKPYHEGITAEHPWFTLYPLALESMDTRPTLENGFPYVWPAVFGYGLNLVVIDCLHAAVSRTNLADNLEARELIADIQMKCHMHNFSVLILHHITKSTVRGATYQKFAESSQLLAASNAHFFLERIGTSNCPRRYTLHGFGRQPNPIERLDLVSPDFLTWQVASPVNSKPSQADQIFELLTKQTTTISEVATALDLPVSSVQVAINRLVHAGKVVKIDASRRNTQFAAVPNA